MRVLVGCEESQVVCKAFRERGHEAYSCDIQPGSGGHPEWHIQGDVFEIINDGWDLGIFHPPCTHLAVSGAKHFEQKRKDGRQQQGIELFMRFTEVPIDKWCIENPVSIMSTIWREPDQIVQPYYFGDEAQKTTCLWLKNLPSLYHWERDSLFGEKTHVKKGEFYVSPTGKKMAKWCCDPIDKNGKKLGYNTDEIKKLRSRTFPGLAKAFAEQWG